MFVCVSIIVALISDGPWLGKRVFAANLAEIKIRAGKEVVATSDLIDFKVIEERGDWVMLAGYPQGYVQKSDLVLVTDAEEHYSKKIKEEPKQPAWYQMRATLRREFNLLDGAIADCNEAIKLDPKDGVHFNVRGLIYLSNESSIKLWPTLIRQSSYLVLMQRPSTVAHRCLCRRGIPPLP